MGIKENFMQAVRELGGGKEPPKDADPKAKSVEDLRRAVEADAIDKPVIDDDDISTSISQIASSQSKLSEIDADFRNMQRSAAGLGFDAAQSALHPTLQADEPVLANPFGRASEPSPIGARAAEPSPVAGYFGGSNPNVGINQNIPLQSPVAAQSVEESMGDELTVISKNTVIDGNVRSFANMNIDGNIRGDIETTKDIELNGKIIGNLTCNNAQMMTSQIQGNIRMKGNILMGRDTLLIGDLVSTYAKVNGKVKGNMEVGGKAELKGDAVIFGDISASTITVDDGAIIQGYVSTTFLNKEESRNIFPETISIAE